MSHSARNRPNRKPPRFVVYHYKRLKPRLIPLPTLEPRCFAAGKPKACYDYDTAARVQARRLGEGVALRIYPCSEHYHLTSKI